MGINISANSATAVISESAGYFAQHDVVDLANGKAYRQVHVVANVGSGDAIADVNSPNKASEASRELMGIAIGSISNLNYGFVQSFGFGQAKVATGTPANVLLVPSTTAGVLRKADFANPEDVAWLLGFYDQVVAQRTSNRPRANMVVRVVSLTAESGGLVNVFIF